MENHEETCIFSAGHHQMRYTGNDRYLFKRREYWPTSADAAFPLCPFCMEEEVRTGRYWYAENFTRFLLIVIVLEGDILFRFGRKSVRVAAGQVMVIPKNTAYSFENGCSPTSRKFVLEVVGRNLESDCETFGLNRVLLISTPECGRLAEEIAGIGDCLHDWTPELIPALIGRTCGFLARLSQLVPGRRHRDNLLLRAQMLLESDFETKFTLKTLAEKLNCREDRINKIFKEKLGVTPMQYRIGKKMELAKRLLVSTTQTVKEISFQLGYCDQFYFSSEFRRVTGMSPRETRRGKMSL